MDHEPGYFGAINPNFRGILSQVFAVSPPAVLLRESYRAGGKVKQILVPKLNQTFSLTTCSDLDLRITTAGP